jgi:hypothetical protein
MLSSVHQLSIQFHSEKLRDREKVLSLDSVSAEEVDMQIEDCAFGSIRIDAITHEHGVVIQGGEIRMRKKKPRRNSATTLDTLPCLWKKIFPGSAAGW